MPNWVVNKLSINNGTAELVNFLQENGFSFMKIAPYEKVSDDSKNTDTQIELWSTKWDLEDEFQKSVAEELIVNSEAYFDTASSPPFNAIEKLSEMFPESNFILDYYSGGDWYAGTFRAFAGVGIDEDMEDDDAIKEFAKDVFDEEFLSDEEEEDGEEQEDEGFVFGSDFNTDARTHSLSSYDPDDEE